MVAKYKKNKVVNLRNEWAIYWRAIFNKAGSVSWIFHPSCLSVGCLKLKILQT